MARSYITPEQYLWDEERALDKHEYINGEVYAMAGVNPVSRGRLREKGGGWGKKHTVSPKRINPNT